MITFSVSDWLAYILFGLPVEVGVTLFMIWYINKPHNLLSKFGMRDGAQIDVRIKKGGVNVLALSMFGENPLEAIKNGIEGIIKGILITPKKESSTSSTSASDLVDLIKKVVKDELNKEDD